MAARPVLLGMNNPLSDREEHALYPHPPGCAGWNLQRLSGLSPEEYLETFERRNLLSAREWDAAAACAAAEKMREELRDRTVVLLGNDVANLMWMGDAPIWQWRRRGETGWWVRMPHPSGRCRHWNDPLTRVAGELLLQELAHAARTGVAPADTSE